MSRQEIQQGTTATHQLEGHGQALIRSLETQQGITATHKLTGIINRVQTAEHHSHLHPWEPVASNFNRPEIQQCTPATHKLKSQEQAWLASQKHGKAQWPLTFWEFKDRHGQQARNTTRYYNYSPTGEPRVGIVSRLETQQGITTTHRLESQNWALLAGNKQQGITATHRLACQGQALLTGWKHIQGTIVTY